jgi:amidohydrolase
MIEEGILDRFGVGEAFALHLWTPLRAGTLQVRSGPALAASDEFTAVFQGKAGHAAVPQEARDPILPACKGIVALRQVPSRHAAPEKPVVLSVGSIRAGTAHNVIPDRATLLGTLRTFEPEVRTALHGQIREVLEGCAEAAGCSLELEIRSGYPPVVNDNGAVSRLRKVAGEVLGEGTVTEHPPMAISEDFAYFLERVPGVLALLGAGNESDGITAPHHSPEFDIDESVLPRGAEILTRLALL